jgi:hypothetical protein
MQAKKQEFEVLLALSCVITKQGFKVTFNISSDIVEVKWRYRRPF